VAVEEVLCRRHLLALNCDINILGFAQGPNYSAEINSVWIIAGPVAGYHFKNEISYLFRERE
jgi:hypothetical protein